MEGNSHAANYTYQIIGLQALVSTVRATGAAVPASPATIPDSAAGAKNIIMLGGIAYANSLVQWLEYAPKDPTGNLNRYCLLHYAEEDDQYLCRKSRRVLALL